MTYLGWDQLGFGFTLEEREDGSPWIKVVDPWYNRAEGRTAGAISIRLQPYASYSEAREIANFLNGCLTSGRTPVLALNEVPAKTAGSTGGLFSIAV